MASTVAAVTAVAVADRVYHDKRGVEIGRNQH
jgi:hypothetical protein